MSSSCCRYSPRLVHRWRAVVAIWSVILLKWRRLRRRIGSWEDIQELGQSIIDEIIAYNLVQHWHVVHLPILREEVFSLPFGISLLRLSIRYFRPIGSFWVLLSFWLHHHHVIISVSSLLTAASANVGSSLSCHRIEAGQAKAVLESGHKVCWLCDLRFCESSQVSLHCLLSRAVLRVLIWLWLLLYYLLCVAVANVHLSELKAIFISEKAREARMMFLPWSCGISMNHVALVPTCQSSCLCHLLLDLHEHLIRGTLELIMMM